jgi:hypothetical protein
LDLRENARIYRKKGAACPEVQRYDLASLRKPEPRTRTTATRASDLSKREECQAKNITKETNSRNEYKISLYVSKLATRKRDEKQ